MSKPPDLDALAKQYLDLWQGQLGGVTEDEETAEIMARTIELMNAGAATFAAMAAASQGRENRDEDDAINDVPAGDQPLEPASPSRAPAAAPPHGASDIDLDEFSRRLERLEKRIAALEAGTQKSRRSPAKKPRKR